MPLWIIIMTVVAGILLIIFWRGRNAVWGGATIGAFVGLIIALITHNWSTLALSFAIGTFSGLGADLLGRLGDRLRHRRE
jgi:hypothetical protein